MRCFVSTILTVCLLVLATATPAQSFLKRSLDTDGKEVLKAFAPVVAEARMSVVQLHRGGRKATLGTVVSADGLVLTKASEVRGDEPLTATLADGREVSAERLSEDGSHDLALLQIDAQGLTPVAFALGVAPRLGQWVVVPGLGELPEAVGVMSCLPRRVNGVRLGIGLGDRRSDGRPVVGMTMPGMGAAEAGLMPGDVLVSIAGHEVPNSQAVIESLQEVNVGDVIEVVVERAGKAMRFAVEMRLRELDQRSRADVMNTMGNDVSKRRDGFASVFQHDATITPGECGGPLLDIEGRCVGLNIARAGRVEAYALPAEVVAAVLIELNEQGMVKHE